MKFLCECGHMIRDQTDYLPWKAHIITDQEFESVMEGVEKLIQSVGPTQAERDAACSAIWRLFPHNRSAYQCPQCGRIYISHPAKVYAVDCFEPVSPDISKEIFRSRPSRGDEMGEGD